MAKSAIILARDDKSLRAVFSVPAIRRLVLLLLQLGFERIHLVGRLGPLTPVLSDVVPPQAFHELKDPESLVAIIQGLSLSDDERILVLSANLVTDRGSLNRLLAEDGVGPHCLKAEGEGGAGGVWLALPRFVLPVVQALWSPEMSPSEVLREAEFVEGIAGLPHVIDGTGAGTAASEVKLVRALSLQTEADDGFLARHVDRRLSRFISKRLAQTRINPNQITLAGVTIGMVGAFLLSRSGYWSHLLGSLLFLLCVIVDGVDGEVARLKAHETPFGHYLDVITDNIVHVAIFTGIAFGLYHDSHDPGYLHALWFLFGGFGLCVVAVYQCVLRQNRSGLGQPPATIRLLSFLANRDFAYLVVALALVGRLNWFLMGAAVGTYVFAAVLWCVALYERRAVAH